MSWKLAESNNNQWIKLKDFCTTKTENCWTFKVDQHFFRFSLNSFKKMKCFHVSLENTEQPNNFTHFLSQNLLNFTHFPSKWQSFRPLWTVMILGYPLTLKWWRLLKVKTTQEVQRSKKDHYYSVISAVTKDTHHLFS